MKQAEREKLPPPAHDERRVFIPERIAVPPSFAALRVLSIEHLGGKTMGTSWSAKVALPRGADVASLNRGIEAVLAGVVAEMSPWEPSSALSRFNAAPGGTWHLLPDGFFKVLSAALHWAERTGGAYDPTIGALVDLWGFGPAAVAAGLPKPDAVNAAQASSGWQRVKCDVEARRVFQPGQLQLDLCAIAKGFAVDEVVRFLRKSGVANLLVEIGGELRGEGVKPDGSPWWVALETPRASQFTSAQPLDAVLALNGISVATSGDEQRYFDRDGRRYAHTIDPRTGHPVAHDLVSVTVVAEDCMTADVLATALTVFGPEQGPVFAAENGVAARFVRLDGERLVECLTPAMAVMLN
ncbi:FAD:protein FMN transferase [Hyphomicrobium sp. LHD-15]|uniref:FAD:protein FMN transferase n=1 Tax=Hyphomicrobium sp. LHD-15 TaxID=3072142 RepID=UPI00280E175C|nr:FAD:protein FMN transferase [Hyphomicrobium sp. LHD-15]MDQ8700003.1 FAD:protein FMN transferase [Hyphomicrobium sp. LHD-15]